MKVILDAEEVVLILARHGNHAHLIARFKDSVCFRIIRRRIRRLSDCISLSGIASQPAG